jgi:hypothetical protein
MLKLQTLIVAVTGDTDADVKDKITSALRSNPQFVDFKLIGESSNASSSASLSQRGGNYEAGQAFAGLNGVDHYLFWTEGDVTPVLMGPYASDEERLVHAKLLRDRNDMDGLYRLDVPAGTPDVSVACFTGAEMQEEDLVTELCRSLARGDQDWARISSSEHLTFRFMGEEVLVNAQDCLAVATVLKQNLYLVQTMTQAYVITGSRLATVFTMDIWRADVAAGKTTVGYEQWLAEKASELERVCYAFPEKI